MNQTDTPVITIDGPTGVGKGTVCRRLALQLGWHYLDSGVLYRVLAWLAGENALGTGDYSKLLALFEEHVLAMSLDTETEALTVHWDGQSIDSVLRSEACSKMSSELSSIPEVRAFMVDKQRAFAQKPGLITDGRDMGTVIFPNATHKIYLDGSAEERSQRRYKQLKLKGIDVKLGDVLAEMQVRDARDSSRSVAPLKPAESAHVIDTTHMSIDQVCQTVLKSLQH